MLKIHSSLFILNIYKGWDSKTAYIIYPIYVTIYYNTYYTI